MMQRSTAAIAAAALVVLGAPAARAATASQILAGSTPVAATPSPAVNQGWQCAQFARLFTGIQIFGDAGTWWDKAVGRYARGFTRRRARCWCSSPTA